MGREYTAEQVTARLRDSVAVGRPVYVVGAGTPTPPSSGR